MNTRGCNGTYDTKGYDALTICRNTHEPVEPEDCEACMASLDPDNESDQRRDEE
jgi:hypothetical protein